MKRSLSSLITDTNVREFKATEIEIGFIHESSSQARTEFNDSKLSELADSIRKNGILQPLIAQEISTNKYELIAGERRLRASKIANLKKNTLPNKRRQKKKCRCNRAFRKHKK